MLLEIGSNFELRAELDLSLHQQSYYSFAIEYKGNKIRPNKDAKLLGANFTSSGINFANPLWFTNKIKWHTHLNVRPVALDFLVLSQVLQLFPNFLRRLLVAPIQPVQLRRDHFRSTVGIQASGFLIQMLDPDRSVQARMIFFQTLPIVLISQVIDLWNWGKLGWRAWPDRSTWNSPQVTMCDQAVGLWLAKRKAEFLSEYWRGYFYFGKKFEANISFVRFFVKSQSSFT